MRLARRILGAALLFTVVLSVICFGSVTADAATTTHSHPLCGSSCRCTSSTHSSYTWTAWDGTTKMYNGYYYLTEDIVLDSTMILDYSYTSYLCLNGHTITCEDRVFDIYSYRSLLITDCGSTGTIETTGPDCTIGNNKYLSIWGGTILNSNTGYSNAIEAYTGTNTFVCGGRVESRNGDAIYAYPGCKIQIQGGSLYGKTSAIAGHSDTSDNMCAITISGGTLSADDQYATLSVQNGSLTMTGGYVDGYASVYDNRGTTTISGGTISATLDSSSKAISITGGDMTALFWGDATVSAGTFRGTCKLGGANNTVSAGNFTNCDVLQIAGNTWIYGGYYNTIQVENVPLYLSSIPEIGALQIGYPNTVSAQNPDASGSYSGDPIEVRLDHPYSSTVWKDGDIVIKDVRSDAVAQKFVLVGEEAQWQYLERSGNNLVLRILPHGTWGGNVNWVIEDGTLTISGTGELAYTHSGLDYPWGDYADDITQIVVEPGITKIPKYAFEYCESARTISLPETVTDLSLNAFQDCGSLNNLLLPASLTSVTGTSNTGYPAFIRCESLTDMYYLGTAEEWSIITAGKNVTSANSEMTMHFLQLQEGTVSCTQAGTPSYYRFDNTTVYGSMYDMDKQVITSLETVPALGHRVNMETTVMVPPLTVENAGTVPFSLVNGTYYSNNHDHSSSSQIDITAQFDCALTLRYGVSSEQNYDKLYILHNGTQKAMISGSVTNQSLMLNLVAGDVVTVRYTKDSSSSINQDQGWVALDYELVEGVGMGDVAADTLEPDCTNGVVCSYCQTVVKEALGHSWTAATCTAPQTCTVCSATEGTALAHEMGQWVLGTDGLERSDCENCDYFETREAGLVASGTCGENITWTLDEEGTLTISGTGAMADYTTSSEIPWDGYKDSIKRLVVEDGVTRVGNHAFYYYKNLTSAQLAESVESIGNHAFYSTGLTEITIPEGVTSIGKFAFTNSMSLVSVSIPGTVQEIGAEAFRTCNKLTTVTLGEGIPMIGERMFGACISLKNIEIPASVTSIGAHAFDDCSALDVGLDLSNVTEIGEWALYNCAFTEIQLGSGLQTIGANAFKSCDELTDVYYSGTESAWTALGENVPAADYIHYSCTDSENHWISESADATCVADGYTRDTCSCGYVRNEVITEATGEHNYVNNICTMCNKRVYTYTWELVGMTINGEHSGSVTVDTASYTATLVPDEGYYLPGSVKAGDYSSTNIYLGPTYDKTTGSVTWSGSYAALTGTAVPAGAMIGDTYYETVLDALEVANSTNATVKLLKDNISGAPENFEITGNVTVDLNGFRFWSGSYANGVGRISGLIVKEGASLTLTGSGLLFGENTDGYAVENYGTLTIGSGVSKAIWESGTTNDLLGYGYAVKNYGVAEVHGVTGEIWNAGTITIDVDYTYGTIDNTEGGTMYITGGTFSGTRYGAVNNRFGNMYITGGTFTRKINGSSGNIYINGGTFEQTIDLSADDTTTPGTVYSLNVEISNAQFPNGLKITHTTYNPSTVADILAENTYVQANGKMVRDLAVKEIAGNVIIGPECFHDWEEATCTTAKNCPVCGKTEGGPMGHDMGEWVVTKEADCTELGERQRDCGRCDYVETEVIEVTGHSYESVVTAPTCTEQGYTTHTCAVCGYSYMDAYVDAPGHVYVDTVTAPTCTEQGFTTHTCSGCGISYADTYVDALGHTYNAVLTAPTCTEQGYTTHICRCGDSYADTYVNALGHNLGDWVLKEDGLEYGYCTRCDYYETRKADYVAVGSCGENLIWSLDGEGKLTISGTGSMMDYSESAPAPWRAYLTKIKTVQISSGVTTVGSYAFYGCTKMTAVTLAESVTEIRDYAFYKCTGLTAVVIPEGVTQIGNYVFEECSGLTSINFPASLTSVGYSMFNGCAKLTDLYITDLTKWINMSAYHNSTDANTLGKKLYLNGELITNLVIPEGIAEITPYAFAYCSSVTSVTIPEGVGRIADNAFTGCSGMTEISIPESVLTIGSNAFYGCSSLTDIKIPDGVIEISYATFGHCSALTSVQLPEYLISIGDSAFIACTSLKHIEIPNDVDEIGYGMFSGCTSLESVVLPDSLTSIGQNAFSDCTSLRSITLPKGLTDIGNLAFYNTGLTSIVIPENVTCIDSYAFYHCNQLESVTFQGGNPQIGPEAFYECGSLKGIVLPDGLTELEYFTFYNCSSMTYVVIPESLTSLDSSAFTGCDSLTDVYYGGTEEKWQTLGSKLDVSYVHYSCLNPVGHWTTESAEVTCVTDGYHRGSCPCGYEFNEVEAALGHDMGEWTLIGDNLQRRDCSRCDHYEVIEVNVVAYGTCGDNLTWKLYDHGELIISGTGDMYDFTGDEVPWYEHRDSILNIVIEDGVTGIGTNAFGACVNLTGITIGDDVSRIGNAAFYGCSNLTTVNIPDSVTVIEGYAFYNCDRLQAVYIEDLAAWLKITHGGDSSNPLVANELDKKLYLNGKLVTDLAIPEGIVNIGHGAFAYCTDLKSVMIPDSVITIGAAAFRRCGMTTVTIPEGVSSLENSVFLDCTSLQSIELPDSLRHLGYQAFLRCSSLKSIVIPDGVTTIDTYTFGHCTSLETIVIPASVTAIRDIAFYKCSSLTDVYFGGTEEAWWSLSNRPGAMYPHFSCTNPEGHWAADHVEATCDLDGYNREACACGHIRNEEIISALGHDMSDWYIEREATCIEEGLLQRKCNRCETYDSEAIPVKDHNYQAVVTDPTCESQGYTTYTCSGCGNNYIDSYVEALGHSYGKWTVTRMATCTEDGELRRDCATCGHFETEAIEATGHSYKSVITEPTCTEYGYTTYTCSVCGESYEDEYVDALNHDMGEWVMIKDPTAEDVGEKRRTCQRDDCGHFETMIVPALDEIDEGWVQLSGGWYYYQNGEMLVSSWLKSGGVWYYLDAEGIMATGWAKADGKWYYFNSAGAMQTGWQKIGGKWYYLKNEMKTGWQSIGGKWYYLGSDGAMKTGWQSVGGKWYYLNSSGVMQTGWVQISGKWYYLNSSGVMQTGWQKIGGKWYYLKNEMKTGWQSIGGKWYYLGTNGAMQTGWIQLSGKWYYLDSSGVMLTGTHTIDGKNYTFNSSGVWIP